MTTVPPLQLSPRRVRLALLALALGGFAIGSTEFVAMGLLPNIAHAMLPSEYAANTASANAHAGIIISAYAFGVVVGAPTIAALGARLPRKRLLMGLTLAFTLATIAASLAPTFGWLVFFRFLCGLPHGAYFGIAALVAGDLMGPGKQGRGVALVMSGLAVANVVGVPGITWIGETWGWRVAYGAVAALFAATCVAVTLALPYRPGRPEQTVRRELKAFGKLQVWLAIGMGAIGFGGFFAMDTFIAPLVTDVAHLPAGFVPVALTVFGLGMVAGNLVGGRLADHNVRLAMLLAFGTLAVALAIAASVARLPVALYVAMFLVGGTGSLVTPAVQLWLFRVAHESPAIAGAIHHSAFNLGNSLGAFLGGVVVAAGFGYVAGIWLGVGLSLAGAAIALLAIGLARGDGQSALAPNAAAIESVR